MAAQNRMSRAGRTLDIAAFLHRNYLVNSQWVTVGEYARYANISISPHLRGIFSEMLDSHILTFQSEPYKSTFMYTFRLDYDVVEQYHPHLKHEMISRVGGWQNPLNI